MSNQDFTCWFVEYPRTHRLAGHTIEVTPASVVQSYADENERLRQTLEVMSYAIPAAWEFGNAKQKTAHRVMTETLYSQPHEALSYILAVEAERDRYREMLADLVHEFAAYAGGDAEYSGYYRLAREALAEAAKQ